MALVGCACKEAVARGCFDKVALTIKLGDRQQKEESRVEVGKRVCCIPWEFSRSPFI